MRAWLASRWSELASKSAWYWIRAVAVVTAGLFLSEWIAHKHIWMGWRRQCYQALQNVVPFQPHPYQTVLILIEDDEYWGEELSGRVPINRKYLATLVRAIAATGPAVIALDFNFESPSLDGKPVDYFLYEKETDELVKAISEVPSNCAVVLPKTIRRPAPGQYLENSAIYDGRTFGGTKVSKGYIALPENFRKIPFRTLNVQDGTKLDSFAQAIVRARQRRVMVDNSKPELPAASFVSLETFPHFSAGEILRGTASIAGELEHNVVIVGAHWHMAGKDRGDLIDLWYSPLGMVPGVLLHANYVEAILGGRLYWDWKPIFLRITEVAAAVLVALLFAVKSGTIVEIASVILIVLALVGASVLSLLAFASVFDFSIPVAMIVGHALIERFIERE